MLVKDEILTKVETDSEFIDEVVDRVVSEYTGNLETYVESIKNFLEEGVEEVTTQDLNNMSLRVASYLFFLSSNMEKVGIRASVASALHDEKYNNAYMALTTGTIADKQAKATNAVKEEEVITIIFEKSYKILKNRYSATEKLVDCIRKVISARMSEAELSRKAN